MDRKKFFTKFTLAFFGLTLTKDYTRSLFRGKNISNLKAIDVKENKLAVKREKKGVKNV